MVSKHIGFGWLGFCVQHVLMEKPMAMNLADAKEIVAVCRRHDRHLMDGSMFVHSQRMLPLKDTLLDGKSVGRIRRINTQFTFMGDESFFAQDIRTTDALEPLGCLGDLGKCYNGGGVSLIVVSL